MTDSDRERMTEMYESVVHLQKAGKRHYDNNWSTFNLRKDVVLKELIPISWITTMLLIK